MPLDRPDNGSSSEPNYLANVTRTQLTDEVAEEVLRQAELRQEAVFRAALAMDQRAAVLAAGFAAAAGALGAVGLGSQGLGARNAAIATAAMLSLAAACSAYAARPQQFRFPGAPPNDYAQNPTILNFDLRSLRIMQSKRLQSWISNNERQQRNNGRALRVGLWFAAIAPLIGVVAFFLH
jgi:hypothetical protein